MKSLNNTTLRFLKELAKNNNRKWFQEHKEDYLNAKQDFEGLISAVFEVLEGPYELDFTTPKDCIHRIYRNLRFSKDKTPYKTFLSANVSPSGKKGFVSGIYIHIDPTHGSFLGGGIWHPDSDTLKAVRKEISIKGEDLQKILKNPSIKKYYGQLEGEQLKTSPRDYPADHKYIDLLKYKDLVLTHQLKSTDVKSKTFIDEIEKAALLLKPFLGFLRKAMRHRPHRRQEI